MTAETITKTAYLNGVKRTVPYGYAINDVVATPNASYTVGELINLIEAEQNTRVGSGTGFGVASLA